MHILRAQFPLPLEFCWWEQKGFCCTKHLRRGLLCSRTTMCTILILKSESNLHKWVWVQVKCSFQRSNVGDRLSFSPAHPAHCFAVPLTPPYSIQVVDFWLGKQLLARFKSQALTPLYWKCVLMLEFFIQWTRAASRREKNSIWIELVTASHLSPHATLSEGP